MTNAFRYSVDYVLLDPEKSAGPWLFSHNHRNLTSLFDTDHGGAPGAGSGVAWVREVLAEHHLPGNRIELLAQPRVLGHVFNPVSFWLVSLDAGLRVVIAEVTNTYGDRHSYLCHREDRGEILADDHLVAKKLMHVSPFQPSEGSYTFRFDIRPEKIGIWIDFSAGTGGLIATLTGRREVLTNRGILAAYLRRPFGSYRVLALIHWQALKLWWKGAAFRARPARPADEVTR